MNTQNWVPAQTSLGGGPPDASIQNESRGMLQSLGISPLIAPTDSSGGTFAQRHEFAGLVISVHEYVEPFQIPAAQPQIIQRQPTAEAFERALVHAGDAQLLSGIVGEPAPDAGVYDRAEFDMPPSAAIERLTAAIADVARIGTAHGLIGSLYPCWSRRTPRGQIACPDHPISRSYRATLTALPRL
jgi:hypothetical protein